MRPWFFLIFLAFLYLGYGLSMRSWKGQVFVYLGRDRAPASVRELKDYSPVDRKTLTESVQRQLMASATILKRRGAIGVRVGHPLLPSYQGGNQFACAVQDREAAFDQLELVFVGIGISASGELPKLIVQTACLASMDIEKLEPVWIPKADIEAAGAEDQELLIDDDSRQMLITLQDIPGEWPEAWALYSVRFYNSEFEDLTLSIDAAQMRDAAGAPLIFKWE